MRESFRDMLIAIGVLFSGVQAYEGRNNLPSHPLIGSILVAVLFIIAGLLNVAPRIVPLFRGSKSRPKRGHAFYEDDPHYTTVRDHNFKNETVELDGKRFEDCEFVNSTIMFHGDAPTEIINPKFNGSLQIETDDPAINNFITVSEVIRSAPTVAKFDCVTVDERGHKKRDISSWTRVRFKPVKPVSDVKDLPKNS
jgi:hypothetical protein